jgi:hypothetical protein
MEDNKGRKKSIKCKMEEPYLVLGEGVKLNEILAMEKVTLVRRFGCKQMIMENLKRWTIEKFAMLLGCMPK